MFSIKKAQISILRQIALALLIFIVLITLYRYFLGGIGKSGQEYTAYTDDFDKDKAINGPKGSYTKAPGFDACPCIPGDLKNDGCPLNHKIIGDGKGIEDRSCLTKIA